MGFFQKFTIAGQLGLLGGGATARAPEIKGPSDIFQDVLTTLTIAKEQLTGLRKADVQRQIDILTEFAPQFQEQLTGLRDVQAQADIMRAARLAPQLREIEDPATRAVRGELGRQVQLELQRGDQLPPGVVRELQQGVRAGQAARGIRFGARPIAEEAFTRGLAAEQRAEQRRISRQQLALEFLRTQATTQVEPISTIQGLAAGAFQPVQLAQQRGLGASLLGGLLGVSQQQAQLEAQTLFGAQQLRAQQRFQQQEVRREFVFGAAKLGTSFAAL